MAKIATMTATEKKKYLNDLKKELNKYTKKLSTIQKEFKNNTEEDVNHITQSLQEILQEAKTSYGKLESAAAEQWEPVKAMTADTFSDLRTAFQEKLDSSAAQVKTMAGRFEKNCHAQMECVEEYVREHPIKSILLAVGAGLILGKIIR